MPIAVYFCISDYGRNRIESPLTAQKNKCGSAEKKKSPRIWRLWEFFSFRNQMIQVFNPFYISLLIQLILI